MAFVSAIGPKRPRRANLTAGLLAFVLFLLLAVLVISGLLVRNVVHPPRNPANLEVTLLPGQPSTVSFRVPRGSMHEGWFFPGLRGAPTIIVCHGYQSQRADVLTLVTALQEHQYNVFTFDFSGHGATTGNSTLGYHEADELSAAISELARRDDIDPEHFGAWGKDLGAYAVLAVAEADPRLAALILDSPYDDPHELLQVQLSRAGLQMLPLVSRFAIFEFDVLNYQYRRTPSLTAHLAKLQGIPKLIIENEAQPQLAAAGNRIYLLAPEPRGQSMERLSYADMPIEDRKSYESLIVNFFLQNFPPRPR